MPLRHERVHESQEVFRRANEEIAARARELGTDERAPFLCECADKRCTQVVLLTLDEYEDIRADEGRYVVLPGHRLAPDETVLEESDRYWIAEKGGGRFRHISPSS